MQGAMIFFVIYWIMVKELEDYDWFPRLLRRQQVDFIGNVVKWFKIYQPLVPVLRQMLQQHKLQSVTDCCSGSGEPAVWIHGQLSGAVQTTLTDKFPQLLAAKVPGVEYITESRDILQLQPDAQQLYTMYNAFHHLSTTEQEKILQQFAGKRTAFIIAEILQPGIPAFLQVLFTATVGQLLLAPFVKPFSLARLFFTYLLPINIITVTYDGIISVLKSKTASQYSKLTSSFNTTGYSIAVNTIRSSTAKIIYITGTPLHT
jgi:hypothetical protein